MAPSSRDIQDRRWMRWSKLYVLNYALLCLLECLDLFFAAQSRRMYVKQFFFRGAAERVLRNNYTWIDEKEHVIQQWSWLTMFWMFFYLWFVKAGLKMWHVFFQCCRIIWLGLLFSDGQFQGVVVNRQGSWGFSECPHAMGPVGTSGVEGWTDIFCTKWAVLSLPWLVAWYRGLLYSTQLYGDFFISQYKDPY